MLHQFFAGGDGVLTDLKDVNFIVQGCRIYRIRH